MKNIFLVNDDDKVKQNPYDLIWQRFPERQIRSSSVWWFFLLLPKQAQGFGPKQAMFSLLSIVGDTVKINHKEQPGLNRYLTINGDEERLNTTAVGWFFDGQQMHENIVHQSSQAVLSQDGSISAWHKLDNGDQFGGELRACATKPFGIEAAFSGSRGYAHFQAWGDPQSEITSPVAPYDVNTVFGGYHVVTWRHLRFAGEFSYPHGTKQLEGIGYFQRVCLNVPPFPWKWIWAAFEDETVFSCFIPYIGPHLFRGRDRFFSERLERATIPLGKGGFFSRGDTREPAMFDKVDVVPILGGKYPQFMVSCRAANGDFMRYRAVPNGHAQLLLDRPFLGDFWHSRFNYNEYPFKIDQLEGRVGGKVLNRKTLGNGFGNCEYTWGLGLSR